ncbi:MAG: hypothetical protein O2884_09690, partial [Chloroflexi bacterium]|nr:hypothetical protein [Chloroflexota bacterium]
PGPAVSYTTSWDSTPFHLTNSSKVARLALLAGAWDLAPVIFIALMAGFWPVYLRQRGQRLRLLPDPPLSIVPLSVLSLSAITIFLITGGPAPKVVNEVGPATSDIFGILFLLVTITFVIPVALAMSDLPSTAWKNRRAVATSALASFSAVMLPLVLWTQSLLATFFLAKLLSIAAVSTVILAPYWLTKDSPILPSPLPRGRD